MLKLLPRQSLTFLRLKFRVFKMLRILAASSGSQALPSESCGLPNRQVKTPKIRGLSPRANYNDRAAAAGRRS